MEGVNGTAIAFNGEIYNYVELREELASGWSFGSHSDTECILAGYARWGRDVVDHLRGMFSFALWRSEEHTSELQSLMRISYAVFCLKKKNITTDIPPLKLRTDLVHLLN